MRAPQHLAIDHAWHGEVRRVLRGASDFFNAVGTQGALADPFVIKRDVVHFYLSLSSTVTDLAPKYISGTLT